MGLAGRTLVVAAAASIAALAPAANAAKPVFDLAGRCVALRSVETGAEFGSFYLKATGLGTYMLYGQDARLVSVTATGDVARVVDAGPLAAWAPARASGGSYTIRSTATHRLLAVASGTNALALASGGRETLFTLPKARGCVRFPEAGLDARGTPFKGTRRGGGLFGLVDAHLHITADMRAGGRVIHGETFDPFGLPTALGGDERDHGADGSLDLTGNLLRTGLPFGTHDTHGWPTFSGWPTYNTMTHQQTYYVWLERAWEAGERLVVAQTVEDAPMCRIEPLRKDGCDETRSINAQIRRLRGLQNYVDAQSGGPGRGWFRLVYSPAQARRAIERGKLAVVIGIESSGLFGCSLRNGKPQCSRADIDRGIRDYRRLGVRTMFVAHWVDNALAGAAIEGGAKGTFINVFNRFQTGSWFKVGRCPDPAQGEELHTLSPPELQVLATLFPAAKALAQQPMPTYPAGRHCNVRGLTALGRYAIRRMMANHILIEVDHLSERAREQVLTIAERNHYPLLSSHNGTGGLWTAAELRRLHKLGGFAAVTPDTAPRLASKVRRMARFGFFGVGLGTDTGGFAALPAPRSDASTNPLHYPFKSYDGRVTFYCESTGPRNFNLNKDGVAHYGLLADLVADMARGSGRRALPSVFRSAEAYLRTWRRAQLFV